jgi:hypothetical protein
MCGINEIIAQPQRCSNARAYLSQNGLGSANVRHEMVVVYLVNLAISKWGIIRRKPKKRNRMSSGSKWAKNAACIGASSGLIGRANNLRLDGSSIDSSRSCG